MSAYVGIPNGAEREAMPVELIDAISFNPMMDIRGWERIVGWFSL